MFRYQRTWLIVSLLQVQKTEFFNISTQVRLLNLIQKKNMITNETLIEFLRAKHNSSAFDADVILANRTHCDVTLDEYTCSLIGLYNEHYNRVLETSLVASMMTFMVVLMLFIGLLSVWCVFRSINTFLGSAAVVRFCICFSFITLCKWGKVVIIQ